MVKTKLVLEWLGACAGCEIAILDLGEGIFEVLEKAEIIHCPVLMDVKEIPDGADLGIISGAIRNQENKKIAEEMRKRCRKIVAFGSCACFGGIPGLGNLYKRDELLKTAFLETKSTVNPNGVVPSENVPPLEENVHPLSHVIRVDYNLPGCPPPVDLIKDVLTTILNGGEPTLPKKTVCDECKLEKEERKILQIKRWSEGLADPKRCFIDQGYICLGMGTRAGCKALCTTAGFPCRGCMGPPENVEDLGIEVINAIASIADETVVKPEDLAKQIYDIMGTLYRFTLPTSPFMRRNRK